jgi:hypothetical protein
MEVDYRAVDDEKESGGGALLHSPQPLPLSLSESPVLPVAGQQQILQGCTTLYKLKPVLIDAPVCVVSLCVDAPRRDLALTPRRTSTGRAACELCGRELSKVKHHRPHGAGRACTPRCKPLKGTPKALPPFDSQEQYYPTGTRTPSVLPTARQKRPYESLGPTQQWKRRKQATEAVTQALHQIGVPIEAVHPIPTPSPADVLHLSTAERGRVRTVPHIHIPAERTHSFIRTHSPLLTIPPERIVPTPLHLFLGISNRIILDAFSELLGKEHVQSALTAITTVHSAGCGGKSDLYDLNGPEISKWIKKQCSASVLAAAAPSSLSAATRATHSILTRWLQQLHHCLLHSNDWTAADIDAWRTAVQDIHSNWRVETRINAFPKLHMLHHAVDFAERHRFLGRASEAQIESTHATFNTLFHKQHRNQSSNTAERLRRSLADATLRAVQPFINPDSTTTESHS